MHYLYLIILLNFGIIHAPDPQNTEQGQPDHILPLVMMKFSLFDGFYTIPTAVSEESDGRLVFSSKDSTETVFLCPADGKEEEKIKELIGICRKQQPSYIDLEELKIQERCLVEKTFGKNEPARCTKEAEPIILMLRKNENSKEAVSCGADGTGVMYSFGYEFCAGYGTWKKMVLNLRNFISNKPVLPHRGHAHYEVYNFCYDHNKDETIYVEYEFLSATLLQEEKLKYEREKHFDMMTDGYEYFGKTFAKMQNAYQQAKQSASSAAGYEAVKLAMPQEMPFALWRKTAYHYVNVSAMNEKLLPFWNYMNEIIRLFAIERRQHFNMLSGAFRISLPKENLSYVYDDQIPVPEIWIKVMHDEDEGTAFILYNHFDNLPNNLCERNICDFSHLKGTHEDLYYGSKYAICCRFTSEVQELFGISFDFKFDKVLDFNVAKYHLEMFKEETI